MTTRTQNGDDAEGGHLSAVENQAALVAQHTAFVAHLDEDRQRFSRIERDLDVIKAVLIKHEEALRNLPDAKRSALSSKLLAFGSWRAT